MQSLFGKRKKKFGCSTCGCSGFGKRRRSGYKFGKKCGSQCPECGSNVKGFDPMAIVQKKLSYGKRRRKRKFGGKEKGCHCHFGKKVSKKPSAATRKMCKRLKVKMTLKRGGKRVYKSEKMLKKQCKTAMKRKKKKTVKRRKRRFGTMTRREIEGITANNIDESKLKKLKEQAQVGRMCADQMKTLAGLSVLGAGLAGGYQGYKAYKSSKRKKKRKAAAKRRKRKSSCGSSFGKKAKKPSAALRRLCKKHKVRLTVKRGKKRVYKSEAMLKKQCKKAMKKKSKR